MSYKVVDVPLRDIEENPHRYLDTYPTVEKKVNELVQSFMAVGVWPGIVARPHPSKKTKYQLAFGHHRLEAAKKLNLKTLPLNVDALSDEEMLKFMGRENGEDYRAEFLSLLNTWEAGARYLKNEAKQGLANAQTVAILASQKKNSPAQDLDIAKLLGWIWVQERAEKGVYDEVLSRTARACSNAYFLISVGVLRRDSIEGQSTNFVFSHTTDLLNGMKWADKIEEKNPKKAKQYKKQLTKASDVITKESAAGELLDKDVKRRFRQVDPRWQTQARSQKDHNKDFAAQAKRLSRTLENLLDGDSAGQKLDDLMKLVRSKKIVFDQESLIWVDTIDLDLERLERRIDKYRGTLAKAGKAKVVNLKGV